MIPVLLGGAIVFAVWGMLRLAPDSLIVPVFCRIPAELAARYYNVALQIPELIFSVRGATFEVIRPCGAMDFFSMVSGLLVYGMLTIRLRNLRTKFLAQTGISVLLCLFALPLAWLVTIATNAVRLVFLVPVRALMYHYFSEKAYAAGAFGALVFLTSFILLWEGVCYVTRSTTATAR